MLRAPSSPVPAITPNHGRAPQKVALDAEIFGILICCQSPSKMGLYLRPEPDLRSVCRLVDTRMPTRPLAAEMWQCLNDFCGKPESGLFPHLEPFFATAHIVDASIEPGPSHRAKSWKGATKGGSRCGNTWDFDLLPKSIQNGSISAARARFAIRESTGRHTDANQASGCGNMTVFERVLWQIKKRSISAPRAIFCDGSHC